jgi:3-(3-hydroxy-phenyl)propionate hydroxylase
VSEVRPVVVVGAGPVGLSAALAVRSYGLPVTVLEAEPADRVRPGSRALFVHRESLRLLDLARPGLASTIAGHGVVWRTRRTLYRGRQVYAKTYPPPPPGELPPFTSLRQVETERHLLSACKQAGVDIRWGTEITGVHATPSAVTLDGWPEPASYVIAADGARSAVRRSLDIPLEGTRADGFHVVVDIEDHGQDPASLERVFHYEHPAMAGRTVLRVPFAGGFQVDLQCKDDDEPDAFATPEAVRRWLPRVIDPKYVDAVLWVSKYHYLQVVAAAFTDQHRRVLLAGEAAHLFPPLGARGMNSGIADGDAAASAIALALNASTVDRAADVVHRFAQDRRAAALYNSDAAGAALAHTKPHSRVRRLRQRGAAMIAPVVPAAGSWLEHAAYGPRSAPPTQHHGKY